MSIMDRIQKSAAAALALLLCAGLAACSAQPQAVPVQSAQEAASGDGVIQFTDDTGREITLNGPCSRIISLYSAHTENLYEIGAGEKLIGVYTGTVYPPEAAQLPSYDYKGDPEQVIAAQPDLVLIRPVIARKAPDYVAQIESAGIPVVSLYPDSYEKFADYIARLAQLTGTEAAAQRRLADFYAAIDTVKSVTARVTEKKTVFMEATESEMRTVTPDSMPGRAIVFAGGINIAVDAQPVEQGSGIAAYGIEKLLENANRIDVYVTQLGPMNADANPASIGARAGFDTIKAIKEDRVYFITDKLINSPTFRFQKGVAEIARFLYPDLMDRLSDYENSKTATRLDLAQIIVKVRHLPVYVPSSSKYYETGQKGHIFGLFEDVRWHDAGFDAAETAVFGGYVDWEKSADGREYFHPQQPVTREALAKAAFLIGGFTPTADTAIADINLCQAPEAVQTLVDQGLFVLEDGRFNPGRTVTNKDILAVLKAVAG